MANNNVVSSTLPSNEFNCKICDLSLNSKASLDVHLQYHKENLYVKWGTQQNETENNNGVRIKSETTISAPADSSDNMIIKTSSEFKNRATPEISSQFPHPATPQSYHSAPSPYQNQEQTNFSPSTQYNSPQFPQSSFTHNHHGDQVGWDQQGQYSQEYHKASRFHPYNMQERVSQVSSSSSLYSQPLNQPTPSPSPNQCDKCGFVCDSAIQLTEHCNTAHSNGANGQNQFNQQIPNFQNKQYPGFSASSKVKEEQEESSDILDLDSQKVVYPGNEVEQGNLNFEQTSNRDTSQRSIQSIPPMLPWPEQKIYNSQVHINGDSSVYKDQKSFSDAKNFGSDQKFSYTDKNFISSPQHDPSQKVFLSHEQKLYSGIQLPIADGYPNAVTPANPDMKPPYRPYDSPSAPQITSTQSNPTSSALSTIGSKGANWKSNEARRPKTYNCTACNKWFTSSGHLKRHYNTTLHKNAVRTSGQPDPATMPISSHHHPTREQIQASRNHQAAIDSNTQSPVPAEDSRNDDPTQTSYAQQRYDQGRVTSIQSKLPYSHFQQGNIDNNFITNNPLANHPLPHQVGTHPLNIGNQPPGIGNPSGDIHNQLNKTIHNTSPVNPPNGEAGPSVTSNHHLRGLLSVSTTNLTPPILTTTTPPITAHTLPPFSHLAVNPYSPRSSDLAPTMVESTPTHLYLGQNFQPTIAQNYPNGMAPHVTDMAINNLHIANPVTIGEYVNAPEVTGIMEFDITNGTTGGPLPSFAHIQSHIGIIEYYVPSPNVGGLSPSDDDAGNYLYIDESQNNGDVAFTEGSFSEQQSEYNTHFIETSVKSEQDNTTHIIKIDDINMIDYANKENYESDLKSPSSPESTQVDYESNGSPSVTSTVVGPPLTENNQPSTKTGIHKCYECDKIFNKACYLTQHNKSFHSGDKPFKCERCGKRFPDDVTYEEHFSKHAGIKPFKCQQCPKSFNHKTDLRRHMCLHSGTKPFSCHFCGKGFIRKDHMLKHCDTHRKKPGARQTSIAVV